MKANEKERVRFPAGQVGRVAMLILTAFMVLFIGITMRGSMPVSAQPTVTASSIPVPSPTVEASYGPSLPTPTQLPSPSPTPFSATATPKAVSLAQPLVLPSIAAVPSPTTAPTLAPTPAPTPEPTPEPGPTPHYSYITEDIRIEIQQYRLKNTTYYAAEIWLTDVSQLQSAFSSDRFDSATEPVKDIADRNDAVLAINGDFATFNNGGIILRNGELYRANKSTRQLLVIDQNGDFIPYVTPPEDPQSAAEMFLSQGVWQSLVFGPVLVENGEAVPLPESFFISTGAAIEPRTAIGQIGPLHYLWIVVDGRQENYSNGMSLTRLQELFLEHGVQTAFNLDGGGSTTLYFQGNVINRPANGGQRHVPDILFIEK